MFLLSCEKMDLFHFKNMFLNSKAGNKSMFLKVRGYTVIQTYKIKIKSQKSRHKNYSRGSEFILLPCP